MTDDLTALRALAEKATPGPWEAFEDSDEHLAGCPPTMEWLVTATDPGEEFYEEIINWGNRGRREDAEFIAAANPSVVLALLDRLERAEAEAQRYKDAAEGNRIRLVHAQDDAERAEAAIERVRALHHKDPYDVSGKYCVCEQLWPCLDACALDTGKGASE